MEDVNPVDGDCPDHSKPLINLSECMQWFPKNGESLQDILWVIKHSQTKDENPEGQTKGSDCFGSASW